MLRRLLALLVASHASPPTPGAIADAAVTLSSYHVSTNVTSRLLKTSIGMVFENGEACSSVHGVTLQLPRGARVTELAMDLSGGCRLDSQVKPIDAARDDFDARVAEGQAAALLTAWDMSNYELGVSVPPNGTTEVLLRYEELLFRKLERVSFQVPLFPGMAVDDLRVDVAVEESVAGVVEFQTELQVDDASAGVTDVDGESATMHYNRRGVAADASLPTLFHAHFRPGPLPAEGLFLLDSAGDCFTHVLDPSTLLADTVSMARRIVFVIDVSGSMGGRKLDDAKASFAVMIDALDERDTFIVQAFSNAGTESKWGPGAASDVGKDEAVSFVRGLSTIGGTNLNDAFLDGVARARDAPATVAPIVVALTDGRGNSGARDVARNVRSANEGGRVKIFSLAFGSDADADLLLGIAIQNGGRAIRIYEGYGDATDQMEQFYRQELGEVLLADVGVAYDFGDAADATARRFPVFAAGSEIVVRGRMAPATVVGAGQTLTSTLSANSATGPKQWALDHVALLDRGDGDCRQSFAQARIGELLEYSDAFRALGDELFLAADRPTNASAPSFREEAQRIALDAHLVWPGLTALVTVGNPDCEQINSKVCYSGTARGGDRGEGVEDASGYSMSSPKGFPMAQDSGTKCGWSSSLLYWTLLVPIVLTSTLLAF